MNNETERLANLLVDQNFILKTFQKENIYIYFWSDLYCFIHARDRKIFTDPDP